MSALSHTSVLLLLVLHASAWSLISPLHHVHQKIAQKRYSSSNSRLHAQREDAKSIYSMPALYDLAFGYRDYEEEVAFLLVAHEKTSKVAVQTVLELAAGPARHSLTALRISDATIKKVTAIDLSPDMIAYAQEIAAMELPIDQQSDFEYRCADMRSFTMGNKVDTAWILLGSLQHLTTNDDVIQCFRCVHKAVQPDGTLILELPHPRETFSMVDCTRNGWEVPLEDEDGQESGALKIVWGDDNDAFDPITQVRQFTVTMQVTGPEAEAAGMEDVSQVIPLRLFTAQEIQALAQCAGWKVVQMYGALQEGVSVNDDDAAFRLVCVLRKQD